MKQTYFISGHRDITKEEFNRLYVDDLNELINKEDTYFVVGDYNGVDIMAQEYLRDNINNPKRVTVYHMFDKPRNLATTSFNTIGGFKTDIERDSAMTDNSDYDIAYIRKGKENSGTAQNILRRYTFK